MTKYLDARGRNSLSSKSPSAIARAPFLTRSSPLCTTQPPCISLLSLLHAPPLQLSGCGTKPWPPSPATERIFHSLLTCNPACIASKVPPPTQTLQDEAPQEFLAFAPTAWPPPLSIPSCNPHCQAPGSQRNLALPPPSRPTLSTSFLLYCTHTSSQHAVIQALLDMGVRAGLGASRTPTKVGRGPSHPSVRCAAGRRAFGLSPISLASRAHPLCIPPLSQSIAT